MELIKLANLIINITKSMACANRVQSIFEIETGMKNYPEVSGAVQNEDAIRFEHVTMQYTEGADAALTDITFSVKRGETVGIIGGTGSGKSTLVQLIPRFYDVLDGCVTVNGIDVRARIYAGASAMYHRRRYFCVDRCGIISAWVTTTPPMRNCGMPWKSRNSKT